MTIDVNSPPKAAPARQRGAAFFDAARRLTQGAWALSRRHAILASVALVLVAAALTYFAFSAGSEAQGSYTTAIVERGDIQDTVTALGNLQPRDYVDVGAQVSGQLKKILVDIGDRVKQGQLLAEIDPRVLNAKVETDKSNLANLTAQLADRQAQLALARANYSRQKRLMQADATSRNDYDSALQALRSAEAQSKSLQAQMAAAQSQLDGDEVTLGYTMIYAPMDGTVVSVSAKQGQTLNANQQAPMILRVADLSTMTVWTQVSEADVSKLRIGMPAYFTTLGEPGKRWTGRLTQIQPTPEVVNNVVLYTATFDAKNPDNRLMTQMTAQVFFVVAAAHNAVIVPVAALHQRDTGTGAGTNSPATKSRAAFAGVRGPRAKPTALPEGARRYRVSVLMPDGKIESRRVVIGVSNRVSAEVLSGLTPGERVIVGTNDTSAGTGAGAADRARTRRFGGFGGIH